MGTIKSLEHQNFSCLTQNRMLPGHVWPGALEMDALVGESPTERGNLGEIGILTSQGHDGRGEICFHDNRWLTYLTRSREVETIMYIS